MQKKIIIVLTLILFVLLFTAFKDDIMAFNQQTEKQQDKELILKSIASIPEEKIYLYALPKQDGWYQGMILSINGANKFFDWKSSGFLSFLPDLTYLDLNNDGKEELVVLLFQDHGTGIYINEVHIINPEDLSEYPVQNALDLIEENVEPNILSEKEVDLKINDIIYNVKISDDPHVAYIKIPEIFYRYFIMYYIFDDEETLIIDNILRVKVGVETTFISSLGEIVIDYTFEDGEFIADKIVFEGNPGIIVNTRQTE